MSVSIPAVGSHFGSYSLEAVLGQGGMGVVYRAVDLRLGRNVALKLLAAGLRDDDRFRDRFLAESRLAASIDHAGIVPVYEAGEVDGQLYIAMRYVEGTDLASLLRREGALEPARAIGLVAQLGDALDAAHARGLVHRDVKPSNALIAREGPTEHVYLADFGITKRVGVETAATAATDTGQVVGTIDYLAPERIRGETAGAPADLYALGCVLFECLTGEAPFRRDDEVATIYAHLEEDPPRPSDRRPGLAAELDAVVARAMAKEPSDRWPSGAALAAAARGALAGGTRGTTAAAAAHARRRGPPRHRALAALALVAVALMGTAIALLAGRSAKHALTLADADAVAVIDPHGPSLGTEIATGYSPSRMATGYGAVWVVNTDAQSVARLDPRTHTVRQTTPVGAGPSGIATGAGAVWVVNSVDGTLSQISPQTNTAVSTIPIGNGPSGVCVARGAVWVTNTYDRTLVRFDPIRRRQTAVALDAPPTDVACGGGSVWVSSESAGGVTEVDARSAAVVRTIATGAGAGALAFGNGLLWVANTRDGTVSRVDPRRGAATGLAPVGSGDAPSSVVATGRDVWVGNAQSGTLVRIDPRRATVADRVVIGNSPQGLALVGHALWVSVRAPGSAHRGGTLRLVAPKESYPAAKARHLDPALAYDTLPWQTLELTNDGLLAFRRVGGQQGATLVPDLATALPVVTDGSRTLSLHLRPGVRYSTGAPVRASDIRRQLERVVGRGALAQSALFSALRGARTCGKRGRDCDLATAIQTDDATGAITFHLSRPDLDFPDKLALPFAIAVPPGTDFRAIAKPLPATGPYRVAELAHRRLRLVRNPAFRPTANRPDGYPDVISTVAVASDAAALQAVERGEADYVQGPSLGVVPRATREAILTRYPSQFHSSLEPATVFASLNTRTPPFDDVDVRRAVNLAVDRRAVAKMEAFAEPSCSVLPANFPAFRPGCPYTAHAGGARRWTAPDLRRARALVRRSGTRGMRVTVLGPNAGLDRETRYLADVLDRLGYRASARIVPANKWFAFMRDSRRRTQAAIGFWQADYPAASNFLESFYTCRAFKPADPNQLNVAEFCDARADRLMAAARRQEAAGRPSDNAWAAAQARVLDQAPAVPLTTLRSGDFVSRRVGHYQFSPQWSVLYDQLWVR